MNTAVIGLGSNMGDRKKNLDDAVRALSLLPRTKVAKASKIYQTKPLGYDDQNDFYNAVILVETELSPQAHSANTSVSAVIITIAFFIITPQSVSRRGSYR